MYIYINAYSVYIYVYDICVYIHVFDYVCVCVSDILHIAMILGYRPYQLMGCPAKVP